MIWPLTRLLRLGQMVISLARSILRTGTRPRFTSRFYRIGKITRHGRSQAPFGHQNARMVCINKSLKNSKPPPWTKPLNKNWPNSLNAANPKAARQPIFEIKSITDLQLSKVFLSSQRQEDQNAGRSEQSNRTFYSCDLWRSRLE